MSVRQSKRSQILKKDFALGDRSFYQTFSVLDQGHFVRPTRHCCVIKEKYQILCQGQGKDGLIIAAHVCKYLDASVKHLVNKQSALNKLQTQSDLSQLQSSSKISIEQKQKQMILNLVDSCFEELSTLQLEGSCCFCLAYLIENELFIVKNNQVSTYLLVKSTLSEKVNIQLVQIGSQNLKDSLEQSINKFQHNYVQQNLPKNTKNNQNKWFFYCDKNYQDIIRSKYFPQLTFYTHKLAQANNIKGSLSTYLLLGSSQCFFHFIKHKLLSYFCKKSHIGQSQTISDIKQNQQSRYKQQIEIKKMETEIICKQVIKQCRRQWKTIYQYDISLIISKLK